MGHLVQLFYEVGNLGVFNLITSIHLLHGNKIPSRLRFQIEQ